MFFVFIFHYFEIPMKWWCYKLKTFWFYCDSCDSLNKFKSVLFHAFCSMSSFQQRQSTCASSRHTYATDSTACTHTHKLCSHTHMWDLFMVHIPAETQLQYKLRFKNMTHLFIYVMVNVSNALKSILEKSFILRRMHVTQMALTFDRCHHHPSNKARLSRHAFVSI